MDDVFSISCIYNRTIFFFDTHLKCVFVSIYDLTVIIIGCECAFNINIIYRISLKFRTDYIRNASYGRRRNCVDIIILSMSLFD